MIRCVKINSANSFFCESAVSECSNGIAQVPLSHTLTASTSRGISSIGTFSLSLRFLTIFPKVKIAETLTGSSNSKYIFNNSVNDEANVSSTKLSVTFTIV